MFRRMCLEVFVFFLQQRGQLRQIPTPARRALTGCLYVALATGTTRAAERGGSAADPLVEGGNSAKRF